MTGFDDAVATLKQGGVIAYPTEAVFGLGCDPENKSAVEKILHLKQRPVDKGLIVIAGKIDQLYRYIESKTIESFHHVVESWPGPHTWLLPCTNDTPRWLTGQYDTLAVRVTAHITAAGICNAFDGPIVSTSANPADLPPAKITADVLTYFGNNIDLIIDGEVNPQADVSTIRDARTNKQLR